MYEEAKQTLKMCQNTALDFEGSLEFEIVIIANDILRYLEVHS